MTIQKFSSRKNPTPQQLKEFRHYVSVLKKRGVISNKTDARVARPSFVRGGKTLAEIVNKNRASLTPWHGGSTQKIAAKKSSQLPPSKLHPLNKPISIRDFPIKHRTLAGALQDIEDDYEAIDALKRPGEKWAFEVDVDNATHYGTVRSYHTFDDIRLLGDYLRESAGIQSVLRKRGDSQKLFSGLKLVRWNKTSSQWKPGPDKLKRKTSHASRQAKSRRRKKK